MSKIGLGIVTYKREEYFKEIYKNVPLNLLDKVIIVNDGTPYSDESYNNSSASRENVKLVQNVQNLGVAKSKNIAMKFLLDEGMDHIFMMEDDIIIKNPEVFSKYIEVAEETKIQHFNFALHGLANKTGSGLPNPKQILEYRKNKIALYQNCVGAFCYYSRKCLETVGIIDERFYNAFDHVDHTYQIIKNKMHPEFWWFADLHNSHEYLTDIPWTQETSTISSRTDHNILMTKAIHLFKEKNKMNIFEIPMLSIESVKKTLKEIYKNA